MTAVLERPASAAGALGSTVPRLYTRPLVTGSPGPCGCGCALTPKTSAGFEAAAFAVQVLGLELLPWQRWLLIHALELRPDGRFRFRTILTLIARQNGKTWLLKIIALYFVYVRSGRESRALLVVTAAQSLEISRESWEGAVQLAQDADDTSAEIERIYRTNGNFSLNLRNGSRYRISAATRGAGRGLTVDLLILDELREHRDWLAWGALTKTCSARPNALIFGISNAGDDESIVLNSLREKALAGQDETIGIFEWSAPEGCALDDIHGWAYANPALGRTISTGTIRSAMTTDPPATFRTETLCQRVDALDPPIDPARWRDCADANASLRDVAARVVVCVDVAPDGKHVSCIGAAALDDGTVRVATLGAWRGTDAARGPLAELIERMRPRALGFFPSGPGAVLGADLRELHGVSIGRWATGRREMRPEAPGLVELTGGDVTELCQSFADLVAAGRLLHPNEPLLNAHVAGAQKLQQGDGWRFTRRGAGHVDAVYAAAGAVHLARTLPTPRPRPKPRVV